MTIEEFRETIQQYVSPYTTMLAISKGGDAVRQIVVDNGTGMFLNVGDADLLVTNAHVYDGLLRYREEDPTILLSISGTAGTRFLDISEAEVLGKDRDSDLVTLSIPRTEVHALGKRHAVMTRWPPKRAKAGMLAFLIGYPGQIQVQLEDVLGVRPLVFGMPIASASDRKFVLHDQNGAVTRNRPDDSPELTRLGGISGSAVYIRDKSASTKSEM